MMCVYHLNYDVYHSQSATIISSITEDKLICITGSTDKSVRDYIFDRSEKRPVYRSLARSDNANDIFKMYKRQCKLAHSSSLSLGVIIDKGDAKSCPLYDEMLSDYYLQAFILTSVMMVAYLGRFLFYIDQNQAES